MPCKRVAFCFYKPDCNTWSRAATTLAAVTTSAQLLNVQYNQSPTAVSTSFFNTAPVQTTATVVAKVSPLTTPQYVGTLAAQLGQQFEQTDNRSRSGYHRVERTSYLRQQQTGCAVLRYQQSA